MISTMLRNVGAAMGFSESGNLSMYPIIIMATYFALDLLCKLQA